jgi:hypothetical protein
MYWYVRAQKTRSDGFSLWGALILGQYMEVYRDTSHVQHTVSTSWCFKCKIIHFLASSVRTMYNNIVYTLACTCRYMLVLSYTHTHKGHNHFSLRIRSYPPYNTEKFPIHARTFHRAQHSSSPQYPPLSDHPGLACSAKNCHSQELTSKTLLPRLPSAAAALAQPNGEP